MTFLVHLVILLLAATLSLLRYKSLSTADRYIAVLLVVTFLGESIAKASAVLYGSNTLIYQIFTPIQFLLVAYYFGKALATTRWGKLSIAAGWAGVVLGIISFTFYTAETFDNSVIVFEGFCIVFLGVKTLSFLLKKHGVVTMRSVKFWTSLLLANFWAASLLWFGSYPLIKDDSLFSLYYQIFVGLNYLTYSAFAAIFIFYPKLISSDN